MTVDSLEDCRIAAIDALGELRSSDPRITGMLVAGMRHEDPATRLASLNALRTITGKDMGIDAVAWQSILPKEGDTQTRLASTGAAGPATAKTSSPAYPPKPPVPPAIVSADADPDTRTAGLPPYSGSQGAPPPGVGIGSYPTRNPNIPNR